VSRPPLVEAAHRLAAEHGFTESCSDGAGRLLQILARRCERAAEFGAGYGVGASWLISGLAPGASLVTIELEPDRAAAVRAFLASERAVRVRQGDWRELLDEPPFDLLFADAEEAMDHGEEVLKAVGPGGLVVLDDIAPDVHTEVRRFWLEHPGVIATELRTGPSEVVILAARMP
jgi:predicted O-methyltransferase YrrM